MGIDLGEILTTIRDRLPDLEDLSAQQMMEEDIGSHVIGNLSGLDFNDFRAQLPRELSGAIPILEGSESNESWRLIRTFSTSIMNTTEAREWARTILTGRKVGAVDGSQIYPGGEFSIPLGLVNIGWYVNHHDGTGTFDRDHTTRLLLPDDLGFTPDSGVDLSREEGEIRKLIELYRSGNGGDNPDLYLLDGSMVLSFALHVFETTRKRYVAGIMSLLDTVSQEQAPLFAAYVDTTRAIDLSTMLLEILSEALELKRRIIHGVGEENDDVRSGVITDGWDDPEGNSTSNWRPTDAILLRKALPNWGDRTTAFVCARDDILDLYRDGKRDHSRGIAFFYMKTSTGRVSRVEFPASIARSGRVEELADVIRAQLIIGGGYPHVLDRAHHEANVTTKDRERFLRVIQMTANKHHLAIGTSLKAAKKRR